MKVQIKPPFIKLDALMKFSDVLPSGGLMKILLEEGAVSVNGEAVRERRKKIYPGDVVIVSWPEQELHVRLEIEEE